MNLVNYMQRLSLRSLHELKERTAISDIIPMKEEFKYITRRNRLVDELKEKGIKSQSVLEAIRQVPRQYFITEALIEFAYEDKAYPIGAGQTISQPFTVARQTELLDVCPGDKILEIGTGSGYQAAVLMEAGARLFSIERQENLYMITRKKLKGLGYNLTCHFGDGFEGLPDEAPFDKIIVTAGASEIPERLLRQLKIGGLMVLPFGSGEKKRMYRIQRLSETDFERKDFGACAFVPMLRGTETL